MNKITKYFYISELQLQGGEFFLHPNSKEILECVLRNKKIEKIFISTNGTIIPKNDILALLTGNQKVTINISNYECVKEKVIELKDKLTQHNISYKTYNFFNNDVKWIKFQGLSAYRLKESDVELLYKTCPFKGCLTIENGYISRCSRAVVAHHVQKFPLRGCGVNFRKMNGVKKLKEFIIDDRPVSACLYCRELNSELINAAEQMTTEEISLARI